MEHINVDFEYTSNLYRVSRWLDKLPDTIACDFEVASIYNKNQKEGFKRIYKYTTDWYEKAQYEIIIDSNGLSNVTISPINGSLTDHYDPRKKHINLSNDIFSEDSIAAVSVAAHECGHAIQDKEAYAFLRLRSSLVPIVSNL